LKKYKVTENEVKQRLDQFLSFKIPDISRSQLQKLIKNNLVLINKKPAKSGQFLELNCTVEVHSEMNVEKKPEELIAENIPLKIIYEDDDIIVIDKIAGMVVHPGKGNHTGTLVNALLYHCKSLSNPSGSDRPGIVHRLDKDTSGLIVCAKNEKAHAHLAKQFEEKTAFRIYKAICWHDFDIEKGLIETKIQRHPKDPTKFIVSNEDKGKHAITKYIVEEKFPNFSLVRFKLETGRTHQIRVHANYIKHPIFSDYLYSGDDRQVKSINVHYQKFAKQLLKHINRQALHAVRLEFIHPTQNKEVAFESPLAEDIQTVLDKLRGKFITYQQD
jgi:23S rRNA pseudouridine1911/1915/1917 synthase